jgi:hypothetical protein
MVSIKVNKSVRGLLIYVSLLFILLLTSININNYLKPKVIKVLGAETQNKEEKFWQDFLAKNPNYIPGLIETGDLHKAKEIDPNYLP